MVRIDVVSSDRKELTMVEELVGDSANVHTYHAYELFFPKEARRLMNRWGARKLPFAAITEDRKAVRIFYSEGEPVIENLCEYINDHILQ